MTRQKPQFNRGVSLLETVIYVALFAILITGTLVSVYTIIGGSARLQAKAMVQEEGAFLVGKIDWALNGAKNVFITDSGRTLEIVKASSDGQNDLITKIIITSDSQGDMKIEKPGNSAQGLNNDNVKINRPPEGYFKLLTSGGVSADIIVETRTSEGQLFSEHFSTVKYLRK